MSEYVKVGFWDVMLSIVTSGFWLVLIFIWPSLAITDQTKGAGE